MGIQEILDIFKIEINKLGKQVNFDESDNALDGAHLKDFIMLSKKDFEELTSEKSKKDKFITYMDNIRKEGVAPENISVLKKGMWGVESAICEVISSRLMNYYGGPTVFNVPYVGLDKKRLPTYYVASVDCISENETFENFYRLIALSDDRVYTLWHRIEAHLKARFSEYPNFEEDLKQLEEDYFKSHVVREFIIGDYDSGAHNFGLLVDEKNKRFKFVNFDYEVAFVTKKRELSDFNFHYMAQNKPKILEDIYQKSIVLRDALMSVNGKIEMSNKTIKNLVEERIEKLLTNINEFIDRYHEAINSPTK